MKCPHCNYEHIPAHFCGDDDTWVEEVGYDQFFKLPVRMETQETDRHYSKSKSLYGCPACNKTFIGE